MLCHFIVKKCFLVFRQPPVFQIFSLEVQVNPTWNFFTVEYLGSCLPKIVLYSGSLSSRAEQWKGLLPDHSWMNSQGTSFALFFKCNPLFSSTHTDSALHLAAWCRQDCKYSGDSTFTSHASLLLKGGYSEILRVWPCAQKWHTVTNYPLFLILGLQVFVLSPFYFLLCQTLSVGSLTLEIHLQQADCSFLKWPCNCRMTWVGHFSTEFHQVFAVAGSFRCFRHQREKT